VSLIAFSANAGDIALLAFLVIVPALAVTAAVVDHFMIKRKRRLEAMPLDPVGHAFPVIFASRSAMQFPPAPADPHSQKQDRRDGGN
jgi:hypothetical protein